MNLTRELRIQLEVLIQNHLGLSPSLLTVRDLIGAEAVDDLPPGSNTPAVARWMVVLALTRPGPETLTRIVDMVDLAGELIELRALLERVRADAALWHNDGIDELWVPQQWPFIDRQDLRRVINEAALGNGHPALVIEAPTGHGKRTTCAYIEIVVRRTQQFTTVARHLEPDPEAGMLESLDADLRIELGVPQADGMPHEEPEREGANRAAALAEAAMFANRKVWFVANLIEPARLEPSVLKFIDELLGRVQGSEAVAGKLRVAVLTADANLLSFDHLPRLEARHVLPDLTADAITEWLAAAVPDKPEELYTVATTQVLADLEARRSRNELPPSRQLEWLSRQCRVAHQKLQGV